MSTWRPSPPALRPGATRRAGRRFRRPSVSEAQGAAALKAASDMACPSLHAVPAGRNGVKDALTRKQRNRVVENPEFAAFARRILWAAARRVANGDVGGLAGLVALRPEAEAAVGEAITGLRAPQAPVAWATIARLPG